MKEGQPQFKNHLSGRKGIPKQPLRLVNPEHKEWPEGLDHHHAPIILLSYSNLVVFAYGLIE